MNEQAEKLISIPLAILESVLASYIFDRYSKNFDADCFNKVDYSILVRIQDKIKEEYEKEQLHNYITQNPLLPNSRFPFISDEAKSDFIKKFYNSHPDLKSVGSEKVSECLGKYVDEINDFLNKTLSADVKFLTKQVNDAKNSITNEIHRSKNDILKNTVTKYSKTAYTAWKISHDKIIKQSAAAKDLLCIISFLDPCDIPLHDIFLRTGQYSSYALNQIITTIQNYSLFTMHEDLVDIHGIAQEFIRVQMSADQEYQQYYEEALKFLSGLIPDKITNASEKDLVNRLIKHAMQLVSYKPATILAGMI